MSDQVEGLQRPAEGGGMLSRSRAEQLDDAAGVLVVAGLAGERRQPQQPAGRQRLGRRRGVVHQVLGPGHQRLGVDAGSEHASGLVIPEQVQQPVGRSPGLVDPAGLARQLPQPGEGVDQRGVVLGVGQVAGLGRAAGVAGLPGAQPSAVAPPQVGHQELAVGQRRRPPLRITGGRGGLGHRRQHQAVPLGQDLVVETGAHAALPAHEQGPAGRLHLVGPDQVAPHRPVQDVGPLEVAGRGHSPPGRGGIGGLRAGRVLHHRPQFGLRPDVELALDALGVGVLGRVEASVGVAQVPQHVADRLVDHLAVHRPAGHHPGVEVHPRQQGIVVQHLLEVGHEPPAVHRIAGEPAAEVVVDPSRGHGVEAGPHRPQQLFAVAAVMDAQGRGQRHGRRELGSAAEAPPLGIEGGEDRVTGGVQRPAVVGVPGRVGRLPAERRGGTRRPVDQGDQLIGLGVHVGPTVDPGLVDGSHHLAERSHAPFGPVGIVGAAEEGAAVRGQEHGHGPTAPAGHGLHRVHVDGVHVGTLLPVDLDVDEEPVHDLRSLRILERLVGHHMAPVAAGVAHREQHRAVPLHRGRERLRPPGVPVHRIVAMLAQVRAGLVTEPVHGAEPTVRDELLPTNVRAGGGADQVAAPATGPAAAPLPTSVRASGGAYPTATPATGPAAAPLPTSVRAGGGADWHR